MSETVGEAVVELRGDTSRLESDMGRAGGSGGKRFSGAFSGAMKGLVVGAAGAAVGGFLKSAIDGASDLNETIAKSGVIFGSAQGEVVKFASQGASALGQTKQEALDAAATFGVFGKAAGLSGTDLAGFSTQFTGLATDLASFHNSSPEEAVTTIGAALRGESEPIRRFGVLLDDASLRAEAMRQGLIKTTKEALTPQQKTLAASALIMKQTSDAQGDFQRTSGGLANQQRILSATFTDLKTRIGAAFLPAATAVVTALVSMLNAGERLRPIFEQIGAVVGPIFASVKTAIAGALGGGGGLDLSLFTSMIPVLKQVGAAVMGFVQGIMPTVTKVIGDIAGVVGPGIASVVAVVRDQLLPAFVAILPVILPVAKFLLSVFGSAVVGALKGVFQAFTGVITFISGVFNILAGLFTGDWPRLWNGLKQVVSGVFNAIVGVIRVLLNVGILGIFRKGLVAIKAIWTGLWSGLKGIVASSGGALRGLFGRILSGIGNLIRGAVTGYVRFWVNLFRGILATARNGLQVLRSAFGGALAAIRGVVSAGLNRIRAFFVNSFNAIRGAAASGMARVRGAISAGIQGAVNLVRGLPGKMASLIRNGVGGLVSAGRSLIEGLARGVAEKMSAVVDKVKDGLAQVKRLLPGSPIREGPLLSWNNGGAGKRLIAMLASGLSQTAPLSAAMRRVTGVIGGGLGEPTLSVSTARAGSGAIFTAPRGPGEGGPGVPPGVGGGAPPAAPVFHVHLPTGDPEAAAQAVADRWVLEIVRS